MLYLLLSLSLLSVTVSVLYWSTHIYRPFRPYRYNKTTDIRIVEARRTTLHQTLTTRYDLKSHIRGCLNDVEKIHALMAWANTRWEIKPNRNSNSNNPLTILSRAQKGEQFSYDDYTTVLANAMQAADIPTRLTTLYTRDFTWRPIASSYRAIEYYDKDHFKWVWFDAKHKILIRQNNIPLNAVEIKEAIVNETIVCADPDKESFSANEYLQFIKPFLDIVVTSPIGQTRRYALVPPQLKAHKHKWLVGTKLYDVTCHSLMSFYASHPIKQLSSSVSPAINIKTRTPVKQ